MRALVQLGRYGDIMNVLPLLEEANRAGRRATLCLAEEFRKILDGVSYTDGLFFQGSHDNVAEAVARLQRRDIPHVVSQLHGTDWRHRSESFLRDSWIKAGMEHRWEQLALRFDRRSREREEALAARVDWTRPVVLFEADGKSSPFADGERLFGRLVELCPEFRFVRLSEVRGEAIFDTLALFDRAHALVTIDTAPLHLAKASAVPVVAMVNPDPWHASLRTANHLLTRSYRQVDPEEIAEALRKTLRRTSRIVHVWQDWPMQEAESRRRDNARASWEAEYRANGRLWHGVRVDCDAEMKRNSKTELGDVRPVPFVRDLLLRGMAETRRNDDLVVLTNTDVGFVSGMTETLNRNVSATGSGFSYRLNFDGPQVGGDRLAINSGYWDGGLDLFAFRRDWLKQNLHRLPDMVMGRTHWDLVFRHQIKKTGGSDLSNVVWHERHDSFWLGDRDNIGNRHNLACAQEYFSRNDPTRPYLDRA